MTIENLNKNRISLLKQSAYYTNCDQLDTKIKELAKEVDDGETSYEFALKKAQDLKLALINAERIFLHSKDDDDKSINTFKESCKQALTIAHVELDKHKGWKKFLLEFLSMIIGIITVVPFVAGCVQTCYSGETSFIFGLFPTKTDSQNKLNALEESLDQLQPMYTK